MTTDDANIAAAQTAGYIRIKVSAPLAAAP